MAVITSHDITLTGQSDKYSVKLSPLTDIHLPLLYKWNSDPEVTYYTESSIGLKYGEETVRRKYGGVSKAALCFLIEANGVPIGECWLQRMNRPDVISLYPEGTDIRRIDMCIGEKDYWNKGIGTVFIKMLIDYAFMSENTDILHCFCEDYNIRSARMWQKHGFTLMKKEAQTYNPEWRSPIGKWQHHYSLTRRQYAERKEGETSICQ